MQWQLQILATPSSCHDFSGIQSRPAAGIWIRYPMAMACMSAAAADAALVPGWDMSRLACVNRELFVALADAWHDSVLVVVVNYGPRFMVVVPYNSPGSSQAGGLGIDSPLCAVVRAKPAC